jgi:endonuclease/exonuclease/phosphatase (EEP) superfamily protein YafD
MRRCTHLARSMLACLAWLLAAAAPAAFADERAPLTLRVLTYNIHGLPAWIARDDPEARIGRLLPLARAFDVVLLQEDFAFQAVVDALHGRRHAARAEPAGGTPFLRQGTGLTLLTDLAPQGAAHATAYGACHGWLSASSDCLADKGTLAQRLRVRDGVQVDVWNTHLDAGRGDDDHATRVAQLAVLAADIERHSAGRAVILGGDFNLHWTVPRDQALLLAFAKRLGLALAARVPDDGGRKRVDYLLYRPAPGVPLRVRRAGVAAGFTDARGEPLSDHPPVFAEFDLR